MTVLGFVGKKIHFRDSYNVLVTYELWSLIHALNLDMIKQWSSCSVLGRYFLKSPGVLFLTMRQLTWPFMADRWIGEYPWGVSLFRLTSLMASHLTMSTRPNLEARWSGVNPSSFVWLKSRTSQKLITGDLDYHFKKYVAECLWHSKSCTLIKWTRH